MVFASRLGGQLLFSSWPEKAKLICATGVVKTGHASTHVRWANPALATRDRDKTYRVVPQFGSLSCLINRWTLEVPLDTVYDILYIYNYILYLISYRYSYISINIIYI